MANKPCRQLNSAAIRGEVLATIIPLVRSKCSILGVKSIWRVQGGTHGIQSAWNHVVSKRNECDTVVSQTAGVAFFFSAISTFQSTLKTKESNEEDPSAIGQEQKTQSQGSTVSTDTSESPLDVMKCPRTKTYPAITYWVAVQSPNGAPVDALILHSTLVKCEVEVNSTRASTRKGGSEILTKLCQLLKDHKNNFMTDLVYHSYQRCQKEMYEEITNEILDDTQGVANRNNVVRLVIVNENFAKLLEEPIQRLVDVGLQFDVFWPNNSLMASNSTTDPPKQLCEPLTVLCNDVERALNKLNNAYRQGDVFKKIGHSQFTYARLCTMDTLLNSLLGNGHFKDRLLNHMPRLQALLKHPDCQAISQIEINRDLVEVNNGWFWSFRQRKFVEHALTASDQGHKSPRAYIPYDHDHPTDAKYFREIMKHSLTVKQRKNVALHGYVQNSRHLQSGQCNQTEAVQQSHDVRED